MDGFVSCGTTLPRPHFGSKLVYGACLRSNTHPPPEFAASAVRIDMNIIPAKACAAILDLLNTPRIPSGENLERKNPRFPAWRYYTFVLSRVVVS